MAFVTELFEKLKEKGIHTALDTSGYMFDPANPESVEKHKVLIRFTDLVLLDIKHIDSKSHESLTGKGNEHYFGLCGIFER